MNKRKFDRSQWFLSGLSHFPVTFNIRWVWSVSWKTPAQKKWHHLISMTLATIRGQFGLDFEFLACLSFLLHFRQTDLTAKRADLISVSSALRHLYRAWQRGPLTVVREHASHDTPQLWCHGSILQLKDWQCADTNRCLFYRHCFNLHTNLLKKNWLDFKLCNTYWARVLFLLFVFFHKYLPVGVWWKSTTAEKMIVFFFPWHPKAN